jgi:XTP/dITP diphosphohydrolase
MKFLVASTNVGKLRDFAHALEGLGSLGNVEGFDLAPLPGLSAISAPAEDEDSFAGNARAKAIYYSQFAPGELVLADDSGLEVDALDGAPGVRSARFAEDSGFVTDSDASWGSVDERNNRCLLAQLGDTPAAARTARYRCVLAAARDGAVIALGTGSVEGRILTDARGDKGFGYDPYFVPEDAAETMAELDPQRRLELSHRGRALRDLLRSLPKS